MKDFLSRTHFYQHPFGVLHWVYISAIYVLRPAFQSCDISLPAIYYLEVLKRLMARIRRIRPEYHATETRSLLHDNVPCHTSLIVRQFLTRNQVCVLNHLLYSPDLAPCDFSLFPKMKLKLKGCFFNDISNIKRATTRVLEAFPQSELEHGFESLLIRCNRCIENGGEYFE